MFIKKIKIQQQGNSQVYGKCMVCIVKNTFKWRSEVGSRFFFKEARKDWIRSTFQPAFNLATRTFCSVKQALAADSWWKGKCSSGPGWYEDSLGDICIVSTSSLSLFLLLVLSFIVGYLQYLIRGRLTWKCSCNKYSNVNKAFSSSQDNS